MKSKFSTLILMVLSISVCGSSFASTSTSSAVKTKEYQALRDSLVSLHQDSRFSESDPRVFAGKLVDQYPHEFIENNCGKDVSSAECAQKLNADVLSKLSAHYFAVDMVDVAKKCGENPLICDDLDALETLFRKLHNANIDQSEHEKLNLIDGWRRGQMSDDQLKAALHLDFRFVNGKLEMRLPSG